MGNSLLVSGTVMPLSRAAAWVHVCCAFLGAGRGQTFLGELVALGGGRHAVAERSWLAGPSFFGGVPAGRGGEGVGHPQAAPPPTNLVAPGGGGRGRPAETNAPLPPRCWVAGRGGGGGGGETGGCGGQGLGRVRGLWGGGGGGATRRNTSEELKGKT